VLVWSAFGGSLDSRAVQIGFGGSRFWIQWFPRESEAFAAFFNLHNRAILVSVVCTA
jgi:hypothetical protein